MNLTCTPWAVRLNATFMNVENTATGVRKLRIPTTLLKEKLRTAKRFMVFPFSNTHAALTNSLVYVKSV
jgi:hypothetical protein